VENCLRPETDLVVLLHARTIPTVPGPFGKSISLFDEWLGAAYMDFTGNRWMHSCLQIILSDWNIL
jgi:hypothetical protein